MILPQGYQLDSGPSNPRTPSVPNGYVLDPTGPQDQSPDETTALGAFGRGAASTVPLGTQAYTELAALGENKPYAQERQEVEKEIQADIAAHPVARTAGQAAGIVAPAVLSGGATAPESLLGAAGQGAAIGAGFGAGNAIDALERGGGGAEAAKDIAAGAGLGAVGGAVGRGVAGAIEKLSPSLEKYAANKAAQAVGMGSKELGNMTPEELTSTGNMLLDKGIVRQGASTQEMFDTAKGLDEQYGQTIGDIGNRAEELGLKTDPTPMINNLRLLEEDASQLANPDERKAALWYRRGAVDLQAMANRNLEAVPEAERAELGSPFVTFDQLQRLKKSYGSSAFENGAVKNPAAANIYGELRDGLQSIAKSAQDKENLPAELKEALQGYSTMHPIVQGLQDVLGRERAGNLPYRGFGMVGKLVGQLPGQSNPAINALTSLGLLGAGHPMAALGAFTATLSNPRVMATAARSVAEQIPSMAEKIPGAAAQAAGAASPATVDPNSPALAPWRQVFQKNAATAQDQGGVQKANAVTDYVLSQRDPAYAKAKQQAADNKEQAPMESKPTYTTNKRKEPFNSAMADQLGSMFGGKNA